MSPEILIVLIILAVTVILFVTEAFRVDVTAIIIMLALGLLGIITPSETFSGFASNAVLTVIAVMILGFGIERTGIMIAVARKIVEIGESGEKKIIAIISSSVGFLSGFIQNIGSVALFLPAVLRISSRTGISSSRLIMPMGFAGILGGTLTMIGSSPLIILNDIMIQNNLETFGFFAVTPVGIVLLITGILYFFLLGNVVLPKGRTPEINSGSQEKLTELWNLPKSMHHYVVLRTSDLVGLKRDDVNLLSKYSLHLLAVTVRKDVVYAPWRYTIFSSGQILTLFGREEDSERFASDYGLIMAKDQNKLTERTGEENAGFSEIMVGSHSGVARKTLREISFRKNYGLEVVLLFSHPEEYRRNISDIPLTTGDVLVVYGPWDKIEAIGKNPDFVPAVAPREKGLKKEKSSVAVLCFIGGLLLSFAGFPISLSLFTGALAMILFGVVTPDEAYCAVDWKTVFLLAGLIPLGIAMDKSGTAVYIAGIVTDLIGAGPVILILFAFGVLATVFSLFMSNVAATVLLVPLVIVISNSAGIDPTGPALLVAVCSSNSFILPTHQVNAFLMGPGGYRNSDYLKAGSLMTVLFLLVAVGIVYILFV